MATIDALNNELQENPLDPNSFARPDQAKVTHLDLKLAVNFKEHVLEGYVVLTIKKTDPSAKFLLLDTTKLTIFDVLQLNNNSSNKLNFKVYPSTPQFGSKLEVEINEIGLEEFKIKINYKTDASSPALMWMEPEQTEGKQHPFMYSQCQAINARSLVPCQDTPSVKCSYSAEIQAPKELQALMSAKINKDAELSHDGKYRIHFFYQKVPIPSYLIAIVVGDLVSKKIGKISNVWAERGVIESAAWEFSEIDSILEAAEHFAGPYVWEVYDLLVLPPSFPYGGMENPCLTFVTPTLLSGDRSLVYVIAHEISHSWTGNLVTNANFGHFWLNEGFTTFLERKIGGYLNKYGETFRQFTALEGLTDLKNAIKYYGDFNPYTKLLIDMRGINPDHVFSAIPYEKGHTFLFHLEQKLGGPQVFEPFLKAYIDKFKYQSIVTEDFRKFLFEFFSHDSKKQQVLNLIDWDAWLHKPGMPPIIPDYDKTLLTVSVNLATKWLNASEIVPEQFPLTEFESLESIQQKLFFMELSDRLNESTKPMVEKLYSMLELYQLKKIKNLEVKYAWIMLGLEAHFEGVIEEAINFVSTYGRIKYIVPLYRSLYNWEKTKQLALDTFEANKHKMMKIDVDLVSKDLYPK